MVAATGRAAFSRKRVSTPMTANTATVDLKAAMPAVTQEKIVRRGLVTLMHKKSQNTAVLTTAANLFLH